MSDHHAEPARGTGSSRFGPFVRVAVAAALSNLGDGLRLVALPLLATTVTRAPVLISAMVVVAYLPWVLLGLPIGTVVDRGRPETFMRVANTLRAVVVLGLVLVVSADTTTIWLLYVAAFVLGIGEAFYDNAAQSLVPRIVEDRRLESANSTLVTVERLGQDLLGPALAGTLFAASMALPFGLSTVGLTLSVVLLVGIRTARPPTPDDKSSLRSMAAETIAGMRWLWAAHVVRRLIITGAGLTFATMFWESTLVLLVVGPLGLSAQGYGLILALGAVGGTLGAVATPWLLRRYDRWKMQIIGLGICIAVDLALAIRPSSITAALAWGGTGFGFAIWNVVSVSARQRLVPDGILARVNSAARTISMSAAPLGALAGGVVADQLGLRSPIVLSTVGLAALTWAFFLTSRADRHLLDSTPAPTAKV